MLKLQHMCTGVIVAVTGLFATSSLLAQHAAPASVAPPGPPAPGPTQPLQPLDQTIEDVGPLSESFRSMPHSLRVPVGFEQVYAVPGRDDLLMRGSGGIFAVFPRSTYKATRRDGLKPVVPAGTVFYIGAPDMFGVPMPVGQPGGAKTSALEANRQRARHNSRVQTAFDDREEARLESIVADQEPGLDDHSEPVEQPPAARQARRERLQLPPATAGSTSGEGPAIISDEGYRERRLEELIALALEAEVN